MSPDCGYPQLLKIKGENIILNFSVFLKFAHHFSSVLDRRHNWFAVQNAASSNPLRIDGCINEA